MLAKGLFRQSLVKSALGASVACFALMGAANASTLTGTFNVSIYQANTTGANINSASQQAVETNPLITLADLKATGTYTGAINFNPSLDTIASFFSVGSVSSAIAAIGSNSLSGSSFNPTTVMVFTGSLSGAISGSIRHDDGIALYDSTNTAVTTIGLSNAFDSYPTSAKDALYSIGSGAFTLVYVEANGLPAVLQWNISEGNANSSTPLPGTLPLFVGGLGMLGLLGRRKRQKNAAALAAA